jgi:hypothetical protein
LVVVAMAAAEVAILPVVAVATVAEVKGVEVPLLRHHQAAEVATVKVWRPRVAVVGVEVPLLRHHQAGLATVALLPAVEAAVVVKGRAALVVAMAAVSPLRHPRAVVVARSILHR